MENPKYRDTHILALENLITLDPQKKSQYRLSLGLQQSAQGLYREAQENLQQASRVFGGNYKLWLALGNCDRHLMEQGAGHKHFQKAYSLKPDAPEAARALGQRGYQVVLAEAGRELGGRVTKESSLPGLSEWARVRDYRVQQITKMANVSVYLESELSADQVREFLPDAAITFGAETGGHDDSGLYLMDNSRLVEEFEVEYAPFRQRVLETINEVRRGAELPPVG